jgi:hypothetical protein
MFNLENKNFKNLKILMPNFKKELLIVSKYKDGGGFTLTELLVAIFIFIIVLGASSAIFVDVIRNQKRALANQDLLNQTSYVLEYMGRAIRMAKKDDIGEVYCLLGDKVNYELTRGGQGIMFRDYKDEYCQEFFRECAGGNCRLKEQKKEISTGTLLPANYLTSADLDVLSFNIGPDTSWSQEDIPLQQPRVTLFLDIKKLGFPSGEEPEIKIQTTISQRNLNVQY